MAKNPRQFPLSDFTPEQVAKNPALKKAYEEALAEETRLANEQKAAAAEKRKEAKAIRDAEKQAARATVNQINQEAAAAQRQPTRPSGVERVTQRVAGAVGASARGIAQTVGGTIRESTIGSAFSLRGAALATSEALGLRGTGLALGAAVGGRGGGGDRVGGAGELTVKMVEVLDGILSTTKDNKEVLLAILEAIKGEQAKRIESEREGQVATPNVSAGAGETGRGGGGGGFLKGLSGMATAALGPVVAAFSSIAGIFKSLGNFVSKINPITALVGVALANLERQDWAETFENISKVFGDLAEGNFLDAVLRLVGTIGDALITGIGRLLAKFLEFLGFDGIANSIREFLNNLNLGQQLIDLVRAIPEIVTNAFNNTVAFVKDSIAAAINFGEQVVELVKSMGAAVVDAFITAKDFVVRKVVEYVDTFVSTITTAFSSFTTSITRAWDKLISGDILGAVVELFSALPNTIVKSIANFAAKIAKFFGFEDVSQKITEFFATFDLATSVNEFGGKVRDEVVGRFNGFWDAVQAWWQDFKIIEPITDAFNNVKNKVTTYFDDVKNKVNEALGFDLGAAISEKVTNLTNAVTNFFKGLPTSFINALPNGYVKDTLLNYFAPGNETSPRAPASSPSISRAPEGGFSSEMPVFDDYGLQVGGSIFPTQNPRAQAAIRESATNARAAATPPAPVVVANNNTTAPTTQAPKPAPRTSGAVATAPAPSHLDRALYGSGYGAGVP